MIVSFTILALVPMETQGPAVASVTGLSASLAEGLARELPRPLQLMDVELSSPIDAAPETPFSIEWKTAPRSGSNSVRITFELPQGTARRWAFVRLAPAVPVLVYRRALPAGHTLTEADLAVVRKPRVRGLDLLPSSLAGRVLSRPVSAEEPVGEGSVRLPAPVPGRTPVDVVARVGLVEVRLRGILDRSVRPGAPGKVRVSPAGRPLRGRLVDPGTFILDPPGDKR